MVTILPISKELQENPDGHYLLFATSKGLIKKTTLDKYVRINRNGKYALRFKMDGDALVNVRVGTDEHDVVMISSTGYASRFSCSMIRASGRVSGGVFGIKTGVRKNADGGHVVGMVATSDYDTQILTASRYGMGKRSRLGTADRIPDLDREGVQKVEKDGSPKFTTDGYRRTNPGAKGVRTMKLDKDNGDEIVRVHTIPDLSDQLFLLTAKGMMIRVRADQTKETTGKSTKGTRVMELRDKKKGGFIDEIIFSARLPAELVDDEDQVQPVEGSEEE